MDSPTIKDALGLGDERLEFYDIRYALWVSCSPSYPHDVKSDCRLLLRHPGNVCTGFEMHLEHATEKPVHMRLNMPGERAAIKDQPHRRKNALPDPLVTVDMSDGDDELNLFAMRSSFASPSHFSLRGRHPTMTSGHRNVPVSTSTTLQRSLHLVQVPDTGSQHTAPNA